MNNINEIVLESLSDHLKKHWKKYAVGLGTGLVAAGSGYKHYRDKKNKELELKNQSKLSFKAKQFLNNNKSKIKKGLLIGGGLIAAHQLYKSNKSGLLNSLKLHRRLNNVLDNHENFLYKAMDHVKSLEANPVISQKFKNQTLGQIMVAHQDTMNTSNGVLRKMNSNHGFLHDLIMKNKIKSDSERVKNISDITKYV